MRKRKVPLRKCVACQEMVHKKDLIRIVRTPEGEVTVDPTGKASGRGGYLCTKKSCLDLARSRKALDRSLKTTVDDSVYETLAKEWIGVTDD